MELNVKRRKTVSFYQNYEQLISNGQRNVRQDALGIVQAGIERAIPYQATKELICLQDDVLLVGENCFKLDQIGKIYIIGAGKGSYPIALALQQVLGDRIEEGVVIVKEGESRRLNHIEVFESSHPIPDDRSLVAAKKILNVLSKTQENDLVFAAITGGSSALVNLPLGDITIEELRKMNTMLLRCGAPIGEINAVRKHICGIKGGRIVQAGQPACVITLTLDTAPPDMPWPDMCLPDPTKFADAVHVLHLYGLWKDTPESIKAYLQRGIEDSSLETLKTLDGMKHMLFSVADPRSCCVAAAKKAQQLGYSSYILGTALEGQARDMGIFLAGITKEIVKFGRPFSTPCALITGGETTVTINEKPGKGGPNQETCLGFAEKAPMSRQVACVSIDTDGTDGPCSIAGGISDGETLSRAKAIGIDIKDALKHHNSSEALAALGDAIITGHTGTNVMNLRVVVIR